MQDWYARTVGTLVTSAKTVDRHLAKSFMTLTRRLCRWRMSQHKKWNASANTLIPSFHTFACWEATTAGSYCNPGKAQQVAEGKDGRTTTASKPLALVQHWRIRATIWKLNDRQAAQRYKSLLLLLLLWSGLCYTDKAAAAWWHEANPNRKWRPDNTLNGRTMLTAIPFTSHCTTSFT